jgi:arabinofuranan 3-O-arabinosyltransferase
VLPAGDAGQVVLEFRAGAIYHAALAAGALAVLVLLGLLVVPTRRTPPPAATGAPARAVVVVAVVTGVALVGGVVGLLGLAGTVALVRVLRERRRVPAALAAGSLLAAGILLLTVSGQASEVAAQVLALVAVTAVAATSLAGRGRDVLGTTERQRRSGRSTAT